MYQAEIADSDHQAHLLKTMEVSVQALLHQEQIQEPEQVLTEDSEAETETPAKEQTMHNPIQEEEHTAEPDKTQLYIF